MNTRTTVILALCLVVVCLYLVFVVKPWQEPAKAPPPPKPQDVWADKPKQEDVERVEVVSSRDPKRVFVKKDDKWLIEEPIRATANKWQVDDIVRDVVDLKYSKKYEKNAPGRPKDETTRLDAPPFTVTLIAKGDKKLSLQIGQRTPTGRDTYVKKPDSDTIYVGDKDLHQALNKRLSDIRDKRVTDFKMEEVVRVKVEGGADSFELVKSNNDWMLESPVRGRADKTKAETVARTLSSMYAQEFISDKPANAALYGLGAKPRVTATVSIEHKVEPKPEPGTTKPAETQPTIEKRTVVVQFGGPTDTKADSYFARIGGEDPVFTVSKSTFTDVTPKLIDLRDKQVARVDLAKCRKVEVALASGAAFALEKKGAAWTYADGTEAELALVEDLIKAARDLKATQFEPKDSVLGLRLDRPRAKVTITQEGEPAPVVLLVLDKTASQTNAYVKLEADDSIGVVPEDGVAQLLAEPINYRKREMFAFVRDHAQRIEIVRGGETTLLTKTNGKWSLTAPIAADADSDAVRDALTDLSSLRAKKVVGQGNAAAFGLDNPEFTVAVTVQAPPPPTQPTTSPATPTSTRPDAPTLEDLRKKWEQDHPGQPLPEDLARTLATQPAATPTRPATSTAPTTSTAPSTKPAPPPPPPPPKVYRAKFAKKGADAYAMVDGSDLIYQIDAAVYRHVAAEMRDRTVARFEVPKVTSVAIVRPEGEMEFAESAGKWTYRQDPTVTLDDQKIKDFLNALRDAKVERYVRHKAAAADLATYKLDKPGLRIAVDAGGDRKIELLISSDGQQGDPDRSKYACVTGADTVFLLKGDQIDKLSKKLTDFVKTSGSSSSPPPTPSGGSSSDMGE